MERVLIGVSGKDRLYRLPEPGVNGLEQGQIVRDGVDGPVRTLGTILAMRPKWDEPPTDE